MTVPKSCGSLTPLRCYALFARFYIFFFFILLAWDSLTANNINYMFQQARKK